MPLLILLFWGKKVYFEPPNSIYCSLNLLVPAAKKNIGVVIAIWAPVILVWMRHYSRCFHFGAHLYWLGGGGETWNCKSFALLVIICGFFILGIFHGCTNLVCYILHTVWGYIWCIPSSWRGQLKSFH